MRVLGRLRSAIRFCFRTRRRAQLSALLLLGVGVLAWYVVRVVVAEVAYSRAERALAGYDFPTARDRLKLAARLRPRKAAIWLLAAQAARRDGDLAEAKSHLARYQALAGVLTPEGRLEERLLQAQQGDVERDIYDLLPLVDENDPAAEQILEALAVGSMHVYHFDRAGFFVHHLLSKFPRNPVGRLIRARMDDTLGKRERAAAECRELLADFPDNRKARVLLAGLLFRAQQFAEAAGEYEELLRQRPGEAEPLLGLARCRDRLGQLEETRSLIRELEERSPDQSEALLECGRFALKDNRPADAERLLRRAVQLAPSDHEAHYHLGLALERLGRIDEARHHFERFKQIEADLVRLGDLVKKAVESPRDPAPRREAGLICLRNGQSAEALRWLQGALEVAPTDTATHDALAGYYAGQGDAARASYHRQRARGR